MAENTITFDDHKYTGVTFTPVLYFNSKIMNLSHNHDMTFTMKCDYSVGNLTDYHTVEGDVYYNDVLEANHRVIVLDRITGEKIGESISDVNGHYNINGYVLDGKKYVILAFDDNTVPTLNAKIKDYMDPTIL